MKNPIVDAGQLIMVASGEYSDYQVHGFFVALREFSPHAFLELYLGKNPEQRVPYKYRGDGFLAYLVSEGLLLDIPFGELDTGNWNIPSAESLYRG